MVEGPRGHDGECIAKRLLPRWLILVWFCLFRATWEHMEVPRLGVESELQLPAYTTATATPDRRHICDLCHSLWQCRILNPLSKTRDGTLILTDASQVLNLLSHNGNSTGSYFNTLSRGLQVSLPACDYLRLPEGDCTEFLNLRS